MKSRTIALLLIAGAVLIGLSVVVLNASKRTRGDSGSVAVSNPPLPTVSAPQPSSAGERVGPASVAATGARIRFAATLHDFGKVNGGDSVKFTYVFTNVGNALLVISNVQTYCGCTTAGDWSRTVEPGKTGFLPVVFNSQNFSGKISKAMTVTCNDSSQPVVALLIQGVIWRPIDVTPLYAILLVSSESPTQETTVRIVNNMEQPLALSSPECASPVFSAELKTIRPGREFELIVRTVPPLPVGNASSVISLKTSSTNSPTLRIAAMANRQPVVMVLPSQIALPAVPLANQMLYTISIRNSGTNALALTDPAVNVKGVGVQLKELQPGRYFSVTLSFPAGFGMAPGEKAELSLKSNHPQFPVIKVPVLQPPGPAPAVAPGPVVQSAMSQAAAPSK